MNDQKAISTQYPFQPTFQQRVANALGLVEEASEDDILQAIHDLLDIELAAGLLFDASEELQSAFDLEEYKVAAPIAYFEELGWLLDGRDSETNGKGLVIQQ